MLVPLSVVTFIMEEKVSLFASLVDSFLSASSLSSLRNEITLSCSGREGGREGEREGERERGREGGREGGKEEGGRCGEG